MNEELRGLEDAYNDSKEIGRVPFQVCEEILNGAFARANSFRYDPEKVDAWAKDHDMYWSFDHQTGYATFTHNPPYS